MLASGNGDGAGSLGTLLFLNLFRDRLKLDPADEDKAKAAARLSY